MSAAHLGWVTWAMRRRGLKTGTTTCSGLKVKRSGAFSVRSQSIVPPLPFSAGAARTRYEAMENIASRENLVSWSAMMSAP
eukprot:1661260-Alexandrium_andersonii.AAC.1